MRTNHWLKCEFVVLISPPCKLNRNLLWYAAGPPKLKQLIPLSMSPFSDCIINAASLTASSYFTLSLPLYMSSLILR